MSTASLDPAFPQLTAGHRRALPAQFDEQPHEVRLRLADENADRLVDLIGDDHSRAARGGAHRLSLDAYGYRWYALGQPDAVPQRRFGE